MLDLQQISDHLPPPPPPPLDGSTIQCSYIQGSGLYYHYGCDGIDDRVGIHVDVGHDQKAKWL